MISCSCSELKTNSAVLVVRKNGVWVGLGAEPLLKEPENSGLGGSERSPGQSLQVASEVTWRSVCEGDRKREPLRLVLMEKEAEA